jgi:hypothetical protein
MASSLTPTTFNITITEEQVVRNSVIKHEVSHRIENVTNVDHRIVTCPSGSTTDLFNFGVVGAGTFPQSTFQYARITNLDSEYSIAATMSSSQGVFTQEVTPNNTIFIVSSNVTSSNFTGEFTDYLEFLKITPISGSVDVEYTVVNS